MKCLTRQWLELTISAYRSRIAYLPHCTRLCYPERNASLFLNPLEKKDFSLYQTTKSYYNFLTKKKIKTKKSVAMAVRVLIPIPFDFVVLFVGVVRPCLLHTCILSVHITPSFMHPRRL